MGLYSTVAQIVLRELNLQATVTINGDDLRLAVAIPNGQLKGKDKNTVYLDLLERIRVAYLRFGFVMKVEETTISEQVTSFSTL